MAVSGMCGFDLIYLMFQVSARHVWVDLVNALCQVLHVPLLCCMSLSFMWCGIPRCSMIVSCMQYGLADVLFQC